MERAYGTIMGVGFGVVIAAVICTAALATWGVMKLVWELMTERPRLTPLPGEYEAVIRAMTNLGKALADRQKLTDENNIVSR